MNKNYSSNDGQSTQNDKINQNPEEQETLSSSEPQDLKPEDLPGNAEPELTGTKNLEAFDLGANLFAIFEPTKKDLQAMAIVAAAERFATFFNTPESEPYALIKEGGVEKTLKIKSEIAEKWLSHLIYNIAKIIPNNSAVTTALRILEARARFDGPKQEVHLRYAGKNGSIYIDLANEQWQQIEITPESYTIIRAEISPCKFRREKGMAEMCYPDSDGTLEPLRDFLNLESESDFKLVVGWLIGAMNPHGPYPILTLVGEQGSSKSSIARLLKDLTDPAAISLVTLPKSERDLAISAKKTWTLPYDNLSKLSDGLSDAFCRLATGGGFRTRMLYTDEGEVHFTSSRPVIMNGIIEFITRQDLADRSIIINLAPISERKRIPEKQFWARWTQVKPLVFGALCEALSMSLRNTEQTKLTEYPRMADFFHLVAAAEPALPWKKGEFYEAYLQNRKKVIDSALEADAVGSAVVELLEKQKNGEWSGKATDLKAELEVIVGDSIRRLRSWPKQANALSSRLKRCATFLRAKGIEIETGKSGQRYINIRKITDSTDNNDSAEQDLSFLPERQSPSMKQYFGSIKVKEDQLENHQDSIDEADHPNVQDTVDEMEMGEI